MILELGDWRFDVDVDATNDRTTKYSYDHCECGYCKNYYDTVDQAYPYLRPFLSTFGIQIEGPCELMPFEPTLLLACYRVDGKIEKWGQCELILNQIPIVPEASDHETFLLWIGEMELPWVQDEAMEEVVSPANLPEFLERMQEIWIFRHGEEFAFS